MTIGRSIWAGVCFALTLNVLRWIALDPNIDLIGYGTSAAALCFYYAIPKKENDGV